VDDYYGLGIPLVEALAPPLRERVKVATIEAVRRERIAQIRTDVIYASARRPMEKRVGVSATISGRLGAKRLT
jgi:hypothetical protein